MREVFSKYGPLADVNIVYDQQSRRSRGFAFVYFEKSEDSKEVRSDALLWDHFDEDGDIMEICAVVVIAMHVVFYYTDIVIGYACKRVRIKFLCRHTELFYALNFNLTK